MTLIGKAMVTFLLASISVEKMSDLHSGKMLPGSPYIRGDQSHMKGGGLNWGHDPPRFSPTSKSLLPYENSPLASSMKKVTLVKVLEAGLFLGTDVSAVED